MSNKLEPIVHKRLVHRVVDHANRHGAAGAGLGVVAGACTAAIAGAGVASGAVIGAALLGFAGWLFGCWQSSVV